VKTDFNVIEFLRHAKWHLEFGPDVMDREPDAGDKVAISILSGLIQYFLDRR